MPVTIFWLLVAGAVVTAATTRFRPRFTQATAAATSGLALLLWLAMRPRLTLMAEVSEWPAVAWAWQVDETAWQLSALLLLLVTAVLLANRQALAQDDVQAGGVADSPALSPALLPFILLLAAAALVPLWAGTLAGVMSGWVLLVVAWLTTLLVARQLVSVDGVMPKLALFLLSLLFLWLAAAVSAPANAASSLDGGGWPAVAAASLFMAAALQIGAWPLHGWRPLRQPLAPSVAALLHAVPALSGVSLLARLMAGQFTSGAVPLLPLSGLLVTVFGLLGFLIAIRWAWFYLQERPRLVEALTLAQASLVLLAGVWAGAAAAVAEARVLALAPVVLFLVVASPARASPLPGGRWWRPIGLLVALAALAGLPLTAGFAGRAVLYTSWLAQGNFILILVAGLMHIPLIAVLFCLARPGPEATAFTEEFNARLITWATFSKVLSDVVWLLPLAGLVSIAALFGAGVHVVAWIAVLVAAVGGLALSRLLSDEVEAALRQAFRLNLPVTAWMGLWQRTGKTVGAAVREATVILEGESGILWLLALIVVFLLAR